ncbi:MAG: DUF6515 family protein [Cyclobacteriaceae bacterium]
MKTLIKVYILPAVLLVAFTCQVAAQKKRNIKISSGKVPSTKVIYKTPQKKVVSVRTIPNRTVIKYKNQNYYYANNKYYTQSRGRYIVIAPKVGFRIKVLPVNYKRIRFNTYNYYYAQGIFYVQINNDYEVVDPEVGTVVDELPADYEKVTIDGETYYEYANILYEKVQVNGARAYEVVGIIDME